MGNVVDPAVSKAKFERQVSRWMAHAAEQGRRGIWVIEAVFPRVFAVFAAPKLTPQAVLFAAQIDFTDYDFLPPSVILVDPFTREPYKGSKSPLLVRKKAGVPHAAPEVEPILQVHDPADIPFLCLPGVREYHEHPAHTGDHWLLHRNSGEGTLWFLLDKLHEFGIMPFKAFQFAIKVQPAGFELG